MLLNSQKGEVVKMTAQILRSFALGIIVATITCGTVYYTTKDEVVKQPKPVELTTDQLKAKLTEQGYVVQTEDEYKEQIALIDTPKEEPEKPVEEKVVFKTVINVVSGMTSIDVGESLAKAGIIDKPIDFFKLVEKRKLEQALRPGSYEVNSEMSLEEVVKAIYGK